MRKTLTISLPDDLRNEVDKLSETTGMTRSDVIRESLREYLFLHRFRDLRARLVDKARARGMHTDEDVFEAVS